MKKILFDNLMFIKFKEPLYAIMLIITLFSVYGYGYNRGKEVAVIACASYIIEKYEDDDKEDVQEPRFNQGSRIDL